MTDAVNRLPALLEQYGVDQETAEQIASILKEAATLYQSPSGDDVPGRIEFIHRKGKNDQPGPLTAVTWRPLPSAMVRDLHGDGSYLANEIEEHDPTFGSVFFLR